MDHYTTMERHRRSMSTDDLTRLRWRLTADLVAAGGDPLHPWMSFPRNDPGTEALPDALLDVDCILQRRRNQDTATAMMRHPSWAGSWRHQIGHLALEMVDAHALHCGNARGALREVAYGEPRPIERDVKETSDAWSDRHDVLRFICEALPVEELDPVVVAFRRVLEDRKEPLYGWVNKAEIGEPPDPADPAEKAKADDRLARYFAVWKDLVEVVEESARCQCGGGEDRCDHVGHCREGIDDGCSHFYCGSCHLNALAEAGEI